MEEFKGGRITSMDRVKGHYEMMTWNSGSSSYVKLLSLLELKRHADGSIRIKQEPYL